MTLQEIEAYYSNLLIIQYKSKPKAISTIQALVNCNLCDDLFRTLQTCFYLDNAYGNQLTILGKIVGIPRNIFGLDLGHIFFSFTRYDGAPASIGFGRYTDVPYSTDLFLRYRTTASYTLTDVELLNLIRIKIAYNNGGSSLKEIKETLYTVTAGGIDIIDNWDSNPSHITFDITAAYYNTYLVAAFMNILPRPMGVAYVANFI